MGEELAELCQRTGLLSESRPSEGERDFGNPTRRAVGVLHVVR